MTRSPAAVALVALATFTGCQAPTPTDSPSAPVTSPPSPTPTPSPTCTPEAGGAGYPCTPAQHAAMKEKDALYAEAEVVYREYFAENIRISRAGGVSEPTDVIRNTSSGRALRSIMDALRGFGERGTKAQGPDPTLSITRAPAVSKDGSVITLLVCVDASQWGFYKGEELVSTGRPAEDRIYFTPIDGELKMTFIEGRWVESCEP